MTDETHYGEDCPAGMVQVQFVGCAPNDRYSDYGWKPCKSAFLEIYVDGVRFRIDVGDLRAYGLNGRGIHINGPMDMVYERTGVNACCIAHSGQRGHAAG